ncbi:hypothetical protein, partial [Microcoleus sp. EPA2]|uniref:hypothetical protein n=1 Tax=Microcoleus sp. EPA2 TaxID=2841654 RepID=UPI00312B7CA4
MSSSIFTAVVTALSEVRTSVLSTDSVAGETGAIAFLSSSIFTAGVTALSEVTTSVFDTDSVPGETGAIA